MGAKITVDSATLANKALEVIEAHFLYGIPYDRIEVVVHPQSIVHSLVEFVDGSVLAQLGFPTMELPILYALSYPERVADTSLRTFDLIGASPLTFEDRRCGMLSALRARGRTRDAPAVRLPAAFNAANEIAVNAFLEEEIRFEKWPRWSPRFSAGSGPSRSGTSTTYSGPTAARATRPGMPGRTATAFKSETDP
jgi:1-deoxy-D-xylulose-5-phosphate reductoisomerase